ncbi:MAG TPA: hypothetical protein VK435_01135, partial [Thermodesulfovibrionales bacterium]|nr:hypothetical protein [Thermodesulfovibrionales bacterium]
MYLLLLILALVIFIQAPAYCFITTTDEGVCSADKETSQECAETAKTVTGETQGQSPESGTVTQKSPAAHKLPSAERRIRETASQKTEPARQPTNSVSKAIVIYFFWGKGCPHCAEEKIFLNDLRKNLRVTIRDFEVWYDKDNGALLNKMAKSYGMKTSGVPVTFVGEHAFIGFSNTSREEIEKAIGQCLKEECFDPSLAASGKSVIPDDKSSRISGQQKEDLECRDKSRTIFVPWIGKLDASELSLPVITVVIAGLDSFNPCAFFVLFSLLGLLIHARSRSKMFVVGGIFVFFSGFIYFIFMAAWLNLFLFMGQVQIITLIAGLVAVLIAAINIKDFFRYKQGVSLTIPDDAKPKLFDRMRKLLSSTSFFSILIGTTALAIAANSYELLCTAGFPMVFTRILTLKDLSAVSYYSYLALYNIVYVIPLALIVVIFTITLGRKKLSEWEGRILKLVSGVMMLGLGVVLLVDPAILSNALISFLILLGALL